MKGFRFVARGSVLNWVHATEMKTSDVDCTDMTDAELEAQVCRTLGVFAFCPTFA